MDKKKKERVLAQVLFLVYMIILAYLLFFAESVGRKEGFQEYHYNLIPFETVRLFWNYGDLVGKGAVIMNLYGNVLAFLPFGFFMPAVFKRCRRFLITTLLTAAFSAGVELVQLVTRVGICDVDDMILNTAGGALGYLLFLAYLKIREMTREKKKRPLPKGGGVESYAKSE